MDIRECSQLVPTALASAITFLFSGNVAVIQLSSDTLSIEHQRQRVAGDGGVTNSVGGGEETAGGMTAEVGGSFPSSSTEGEQVVRCDISIKGFHLQVFVLFLLVW